LFAGFTAALGDALLQLLFFLPAFLLRERLVVARHEAFVRRTFEQGHVEGRAFALLDMAAGINVALLLAASP
jgi:hypothetical protein